MVITTDSGIYSGTLNHRRFSPAFHVFDYDLFMVMLDVDRIPLIMNRSRLTGHNRFRWASFYDGDHFGDPSLSLRDRVLSDAAANGLDLPDGPILLLTHLRYLGYAFNPVSFFYCHDRDGQLVAILAEVNNTFGESRNYWLTSRNQLEAHRGLRKYRAEKELHVSPFFPMDMEYEFTLSEPGQRLVVHMSAEENEDRVFDATLSLELREWSSRNLLRVLARHPWMTLRVISAIHWQALLLWLKKVPVVPHPAGRDWKVW